MGGYVVFQDLSMGLAGPLGGWLALHAGVPAIYLAGGIGAFISALLALAMMRQPGGPAEASGPVVGTPE
jgi:hypothetical protein